MNWLAKIIPDSVVQKFIDSLFLKYVQVWLTKAAAAAVAHGVLTAAQAGVDTQSILEWCAGGGVIFLNHLLTYAMHGKQQDAITNAYTAGVTAGATTYSAPIATGGVGIANTQITEDHHGI